MKGLREELAGEVKKLLALEETVNAMKQERLLLLKQKMISHSIEDIEI